MQVHDKKGIQEEEESVFTKLLFKYMPYWPLFLILLVLSGVLARIYLRYALPIYQTTAAILVKDQKNGVDDQNLMEQLDLFGSKKFVENEIEVLQSRILMRKVVVGLSLYAPITYEGKIRSMSAYVFSPVVIQAQHPDSARPVGKVYFTYDSLTRTVAIGQTHYKLYEWIHNDSLGDIRFIPNRAYQSPTLKKPLYFSIVSVKGAADQILKGLKATQATKLSSVIDLTLKDAVPQRGEDILDSLISTYEQAAISDKNLLAASTLKFINERLSLMNGELDSMEKGIQQYKTNNGIFDISAQGQLYLDNVGANDQKLSEIDVQLAVMDQVEKYVMSKKNEPGIVPSTMGLDDPELVGLLQQLYTLEIQYDGLSKTTGQNNPVLQTIQTQIDKIKPSILENIQTQRQNLLAGKKNLTHTSDQYASILRGVPEKERGLIRISREQIIMNTIYSFLLQKREETALSYYAAIADTRVVDAAESTDMPISPKPMLIYLIAIIAAVGVGSGLIAIREVFNPNIVFRKEIEQATSVPILGEIMFDSSGEPFALMNSDKSYIAEQFRTLRTTLAYIGVNNRHKKILITSSVGGEGKSYVSSNLALTLAMADKKVVLLELDLRKPKLSKIFNLSREVGLTNYFVGDKDADHIIKPTAINKNLFVIPSGPNPPNPSELMMNGRLKELLDYLSGIFDYIIMDSAPVGPVTDAYILSEFTDATLYIVRHGYTPRTFVKRLDEMTRIHPLKNLAIVFNGIKNRGLGSYGYGYGYGYGARYGYGPDEKKKSKKGLGKLASKGQ